MKRLIAAALLVGMICFDEPHAAQAELYECEGTWTNRPCTGKAGRTLEEAPHSPTGSLSSSDQPLASDSNAREPLAPRSELARKLRKLNEEYRAKKGVTLSTTEIELFRKYCEDPVRTVQECKDRFTEENARLTALNQKEEELSLEAERNEIEAKKLKAIRGY